MSGDAKAQHQDFVATMKKANAAMVAYVKEYFKTGLSWNPKGGELSDYTPGNAPAAAAKAAAPAPAEPTPAKKAPAKKKAAGGGAAAIFGELKRKAAGGDSAATGMKKVTR